MNSSIMILEVKNFHYFFDGRPVLADLNFSLPAGAYLSIIGPNGAGKTTLLKCLLRLHESGHSQGRILVKQKDLGRYRQKDLARLLSYVPQAGGWIPPFSVREFVSLSRYARKSLNGPGRDGQAAVEQALAMTGLNNLAERPLRTLSGGERQKAYLAAALAQEAQIMLLDEPAAALDPKQAAEVNSLLRQLNQEQSLTMLTVTHNLSHPFYMDSQVLLLGQGRQVYFGPAAGLADLSLLNQTYGHEFTLFSHPVTGRPAILSE